MMILDEKTRFQVMYAKVQLEVCLKACQSKYLKLNKEHLLGLVHTAVANRL
jgi:hypothetical protein